MALWSTKRRFAYGGIFILVVGLIIGYIFWGVFYSTPTCTDGKKNGDESGVDCGGACINVCTTDTLTPVVLWSKVFNVSGDVYTTVAWVENPNINSKNRRAEYQFSIYDENKKLITVRDGITDIPKGKKFAVFETGIVLQGAKPRSAELNFESFGTWEKDESKEVEVNIEYDSIQSASTTPYIQGKVSNPTLEDIRKLEIVVLLLDDRENVIGASRTYVDNLLRESTQDFVFTWQKPFPREVSVINMVYRAL